MVTTITVQYCRTLEFAGSLLRRDCHEFIAKNRRQLDWALFAYQEYGEDLVPRASGGTEFADPYGQMTFHILRYDGEHGHTPNAEQLASHMRNANHEPKKWGFNNPTNLEQAEVLEQYMAGIKAGDYPEPEDAEITLPQFVKRAQFIRLAGACKEACERALGLKQIWDSGKREKRRSEYKDARRLLENILRFDLQPEGEAKTVSVPDIPEDAVYGWLGEKAKESGMPLGFIYPALVGVYAGNKLCTDRNVHPCVFVAIAADIHTGKSQAIDRAEQILDAKDMKVRGGFVCRRSASSDRGLFKLFGDDPKEKDKSVPTKAGGTFVMCLTELRHMFTKMAMKESALPIALCQLWDSGKDAGTADKFNSSGCAVNLSIVGGLKCANTDEFGEVFGSGSMHGLYDRFVISCDSHKWEFMPFEGKGEIRKPALIEIPKSAWQKLAAWRRQKPGRERLAEIAIRWAVITEAAEHGQDFEDVRSEEHQEKVLKAVDGIGDVENAVVKPCKAALSDEALQAALRFVEWQEEVRAAYTPSVAISDEARATETVLKALEETGGFKWSTIAKNRHWNEHYGSSLMARVRKGLELNGLMAYDHDSGWCSPC